MAGVQAARQRVAGIREVVCCLLQHFTIRKVPCQSPALHSQLQNIAQAGSLLFQGFIPVTYPVQAYRHTYRHTSTQMTGAISTRLSRHSVCPAVLYSHSMLLHAVACCACCVPRFAGHGTRCMRTAPCYCERCIRSMQTSAVLHDCIAILQQSLYSEYNAGARDSYVTVQCHLGITSRMTCLAAKHDAGVW